MYTLLVTSVVDAYTFLFPLNVNGIKFLCLFVFSSVVYTLLQTSVVDVYIPFKHEWKFLPSFTHIHIVIVG